MAPKAIETRYKGYRFRSRLEARWAVFFDAAGIEYEYEHQGYDLGKFGWYLPDFWLPDLLTWVEVKATPQIAASTEPLIKALSLETCGSAIVVGGLPGESSVYASWFEIGGDGGGMSDTHACGYRDGEQGFLVCPVCGPFFAYYGFDHLQDKYTAYGHDEDQYADDSDECPDDGGPSPVPTCKCWIELQRVLSDGERVIPELRSLFEHRAKELALASIYNTIPLFRIAKEARFEHGEHPITGR
jgi:hypothetical protein